MAELVTFRAIALRPAAVVQGVMASNQHGKAPATNREPNRIANSERVAQLLTHKPVPSCFNEHPTCEACRELGQNSEGVLCGSCLGYGWVLCAACREHTDSFGRNLGELQRYGSADRRRGLLLAVMGLGGELVAKDDH